MQSQILLEKKGTKISAYYVLEDEINKPKKYNLSFVQNSIFYIGQQNKDDFN